MLNSNILFQAWIESLAYIKFDKFKIHQQLSASNVLSF